MKFNAINALYRQCFKFSAAAPRVISVGTRTVGLLTCCGSSGRNDLNRLPEPEFDFALSKQQTALVRDPILGRFSRELAMPFSDLGITR
jgi:hypothetical protein